MNEEISNIKVKVGFKSIKVMIAWIWLVTAIDIWCCQWLTVETELNPIARIIYSNFGIWSMVSCKVLGTYIATEWLRHLPFYFSVILSLVMLLLLLVLLGIIPV